MASNAENVSIWWRPHAKYLFLSLICFVFQNCWSNFYLLDAAFQFDRGLQNNDVTTPSNRSMIKWSNREIAVAEILPTKNGNGAFNYYHLVWLSSVLDSRARYIDKNRWLGGYHGDAIVLFPPCKTISQHNILLKFIHNLHVLRIVGA